jgi:hypothetical protein
VVEQLEADLVELSAADVECPGRSFPVVPVLLVRPADQPDVDTIVAVEPVAAAPIVSDERLPEIGLPAERSDELAELCAGRGAGRPFVGLLCSGA